VATVIPRLHDTTCCQTGCQTGLYKRFDNRFDNRLYRVNGALQYTVYSACTTAVVPCTRPASSADFLCGIELRSQTFFSVDRLITLPKHIGCHHGFCFDRCCIPDLVVSRTQIQAVTALFSVDVCVGLYTYDSAYTAYCLGNDHSSLSCVP